jgi:hypothetical protein
MTILETIVSKYSLARIFRVMPCRSEGRLAAWLWWVILPDGCDSGPVVAAGAVGFHEPVGVADR